VSPGDRRAVAAWLLACAALTLAMVVVGGITRLTESGLSIVEWQPLVGALPPLNQADWEALFAKYRASPQFLKVFPDMTVEGFKSICTCSSCRGESSPGAWRGSSPACSCSAACKARWAGTW